MTFAHASPDTPTVDVWINGKKEISNLAYGKASDPWELPEGSVQIDLKEKDKTFLSQNIKVKAGQTYILAAIGKAVELRADVIECENKAGKANTIVMNASPGSAAIDVYIDGDKQKSIAYGKRFDTVQGPGKHKFELKDSSATLLTKEIELKADTFYCLLVTGYSSGEPKLGLTTVEVSFAPKKAK
jgi:hypothetical protein